MAFDKKPRTWLGTSWGAGVATFAAGSATFAAGTAVFNSGDALFACLVSEFPELTAAEAHESTGDIRKVLFAWAEDQWLKWDATATADRPANMTLRKTARVDASTMEVISSYTFEFVLTPGSLEVSDE